MRFLGWGRRWLPPAFQRLALAFAGIFRPQEPSPARCAAESIELWDYSTILSRVTDWPDPEAACRRTLDRQLELASTGRHRVKVPAPRGLMRRGGGRHHHFTPET